jgi:hypothetical protein
MEVLLIFLEMSREPFDLLGEESLMSAVAFSFCLCERAIAIESATLSSAERDQGALE